MNIFSRVHNSYSSKDKEYSQPNFDHLICKPMSINNVELVENYTRILGNSQQVPFSLGPSEVIKLSTPTSRQSLSISLRDPVSRRINITANDGYIYLTNLRLIYITAFQGDINTFLIDMKGAPDLHFSHALKSPWFGPNYWEFMFFNASRPNVVTDGLPKNEWFKGKIAFNDGGIFSFVEIMNQVLNDAGNNAEIDEELPRYTPT